MKSAGPEPKKEQNSGSDGRGGSRKREGGSSWEASIRASGVLKAGVQLAPAGEGREDGAKLETPEVPDRECSPSRSCQW